MMSTSTKATKTSQATQWDSDPSRSKALECARAAIDKKAENLKILDLSGLSGFTDYFVICNGTSDRQVQAIASSIESAMKDADKRAISIEGLTDGRWVLMDFGDVVVHIFLDALREYYDLERLWADAPAVKIPSEFYGTAGSRLN